jgi:hypothetical protein
MSREETRSGALAASIRSVILSRVAAQPSPRLLALLLDLHEHGIPLVVVRAR